MVVSGDYLLYRSGKDVRQEIGMNKSTQIDLVERVWPKNTEGETK
jgi:hypothetical protein